MHQSIILFKISFQGPIAMAQIQESQSTNEIKDEIKSLKGLLLSR